MPPASSLRLFAILLTLSIGACADTLTSEDTASSTTLQRDYDKSLTKSEQEAVISDLQNAKSKQQGGAASDPAASSGAQSAEQRN